MVLRLPSQFPIENVLRDVSLTALRARRRRMVSFNSAPSSPATEKRASPPCRCQKPTREAPLGGVTAMVVWVLWSFVCSLFARLPWDGGIGKPLVRTNIPYSSEILGPESEAQAGGPGGLQGSRVTPHPPGLQLLT